VELDLSPEPSPEEREAIERALAAVAPEPPVSGWWRAGVVENVCLDQAAAGPRSSAGASRA
jgi:hypothetical protein